MFDLFSPSYTDLNEISKGHALNSIALIALLTDKGLISTDEFREYKEKCLPVVEEIWKEAREVKQEDK